ncbi:MAG TPA: Ca2+-dependent phosphoinositide-specific phospholipase C [Pseudoxanthomonas sp.]
MKHALSFSPTIRVLVAVLLLSVTLACAAAELRINQVQVIGTHNSYSQPADPRVFEIMGRRLRPIMEALGQRMSAQAKAQFADEHPNKLTDDLAGVLEYRFPTIDAQLRSGLRSLEFDLNVDHEGGRFLDPLSYRLLRQRGDRNLEPLYVESLKEPGLKTLHIADVDFRSSCPTFRSCLQQMRAWSDANPGHSLVYVLLEPKLFNVVSALPEATQVAPFDVRAFVEMDDSIRHILGAERVITPDEVRGTFPTLEQGALAGHWPTVAQARGKFIFLMIAGADDAYAPYLDGHPNLEGRMAFVRGQPGSKHTAFVMIDNALTRGAEISDLVRKGYLVRTRADIDTGEARQNDTRRRDAALASGAQIISTDYPFAPNIFGNDYSVPPFTNGERPSPVNSQR